MFVCQQLEQTTQAKAQRCNSIIAILLEASDAQMKIPPMKYTPDPKYEINDELKRRVENASPTGSRCLIENCSKERAVQFCHFVPRNFTTSEGSMNNVEWCWNMRWNSLNLDSRYNIMCVGASLRELFVRRWWSLLPDAAIIDQYYNTLSDAYCPRANRNTFPHIPNDIFNYRIIPLRHMESVGLTRQEDDKSSTDTSVVSYVHPFDLFPIIRSHIHPKFAILGLGRILAMNFRLMDAFKDSPHMDSAYRICVLYQAWTCPLPELEAIKTASYGFRFNNGSDGFNDDGSSNDSSTEEQVSKNESNASERTRSHRALNLKRPRSSSSTRYPTKRRRHQLCLFRRYVADHETVVGEHCWSMKNILYWRQNVHT